MSRGAIIASALVAVALATGFLAGNRFSRNGDMERQLLTLDGQVAKLKTEADTRPSGAGQELRGLRNEVVRLRNDLSKIEAAAGPAESTPDDERSTTEPTELHSTTDAAKLIRDLGSDASADHLAANLVTLDSWTVAPKDEKSFTDIKLQQVVRLRMRVKEEVVALQKAALDAPNGAEAAKKHAEAGQVLSLYPMSEDKTVLEEAKTLAAQQVEVAGRIDVIRRQRYNRWSAGRVAAAIDDYNKTSSYLHPTAENEKLVVAATADLGQIDPPLMEPAVLELYNYALDLTKGSISEYWKTELAKRLTDPSIKRMTLGDF